MRRNPVSKDKLRSAITNMYRLVDARKYLVFVLATLLIIAVITYHHQKMNESKTSDVSLHHSQPHLEDPELDQLRLTSSNSLGKNSMRQSIRKKPNVVGHSGIVELQLRNDQEQKGHSINVQHEK